MNFLEKYFKSRKYSSEKQNLKRWEKYNIQKNDEKIKRKRVHGMETRYIIMIFKKYTQKHYKNHISSSQASSTTDFPNF